MAVIRLSNASRTARLNALVTAFGGNGLNRCLTVPEGVAAHGAVSRNSISPARAEGCPQRATDCRGGASSRCRATHYGWCW